MDISTPLRFTKLCKHMYTHYIYRYLCVCMCVTLPVCISKNVVVRRYVYGKNIQGKGHLPVNYVKKNLSEGFLEIRVK